MNRSEFHAYNNSSCGFFAGIKIHSLVWCALFAPFAFQNSTLFTMFPYLCRVKCCRVSNFDVATHDKARARIHKTLVEFFVSFIKYAVLLHRLPLNNASMSVLNLSHSQHQHVFSFTFIFESNQHLARL